MGYDFSLQQQY